MKDLLITGFEPFGGHGSNPAWEAVSRLPDRIGHYRLHKRRLPTVYGEAADTVIRAAEESHAQVIVCVGLASGRDAVTPERIAVNIRDARSPDNAGRLCSGERIDPHGPAAWFSTLDVEAMAEAIRACHIPASVSNTAGTYVCNDVLYSILNRFQGTQVRCGFIHVPNTPQMGTPNLPLERIVEALRAAIAVL